MPPTRISVLDLLLLFQLRSAGKVRGERLFCACLSVAFCSIASNTSLVRCIASVPANECAPSVLNTLSAMPSKERKQRTVQLGRFADGCLMENAKHLDVYEG